MTDIYDIYYSTGGGPIIRGGSDVWVNYWIDNIAPKLKVKPILLIHNQKPSDGLAPNYNQVSPEPPQHFAVVEGMDEKVKEVDEKIEIVYFDTNNTEQFDELIKNSRRVNILDGHYKSVWYLENNKDKIYSKRSSKIDLIENGDNFLLYSITNQYDRVPDLTDQTTKNEIRNLIYQKGKFDQNRSVLEEIQKKEFDNNKFLEIGSSNIEYLTLNSINDNNKFETNSVKILYSLPINSFTLINDKDNEIYLVKLASSKKNIFNRTDENYLKFASNQNTNSRKTILQSYDQLLNDKYQVQLNQKTIDRVKNYFK